MLVDGDGYIFQSKFFQDKESGGAAAAQQLLSDVKSYVKANLSKAILTDFEVMVNVYANKRGLAKMLTEAGYLSAEAELESFFRQFNQSQPLFHFIDCGYGKESADAKLRGESPILCNALVRPPPPSHQSQADCQARGSAQSHFDLVLAFQHQVVRMLSGTQIRTGSSLIIVTAVTYYWHAATTMVMSLSSRSTPTTQSSLQRRVWYKPLSLHTDFRRSLCQLPVSNLSSNRSRSCLSRRMDQAGVLTLL